MTSAPVPTGRSAVDGAQAGARPEESRFFVKQGRSTTPAAPLGDARMARPMPAPDGPARAHRAYPLAEALP